MTSEGGISVTACENGAVLVLRNPSRRNAITTSMWHAIAAFAKNINAQQDVRYVVIRGDGNAFCAGADINDFKTSRAGAAASRSYDDLVESTCQLVEAIEKPTIAVIVGPCMGAGLSLAASCDLRLASHDAFFALPAAKIGLGYDPRGIKRLLRVVGADAARELIYLGERIPAQRAYQIGAISALFDTPDAVDGAMKWVRRIGPNAPLTIKAAKAAIRAYTMDDAGMLSKADHLYAAADASADYTEGLRAFAEKRTPRFSGL